MKKSLNFDSLEGRQMMASNVTVGLAGNVLAIVGSAKADDVRISNPDQNTVLVDVKGQKPVTFAASKVGQIILKGGNGDDSLVNLTNINAVVQGGNGNDYIQNGLTLGVGGNDVIDGGNGDDIIFDSGGTNVINGGNGSDNIWGFGTDVINGGNGSDTVYNIVGSGVINGGSGNDRVITNGNFTNVADKADRPAVVFKARASTVALDNGVLYFAGDATNNVVDIEDNGDGTITTTYTDSSGTRVDTFQKSAVTQIAGVLGAGDDVLTNNTKIDSVFYGAAGNDILSGGGGSDLLKGGADNDVLLGNGGDDDLTGDGGTDVLDGGRGRNTVRAGFDVQDILLANNGDTVIGDPLSIFGKPKKQVGSRTTS